MIFGRRDTPPPPSRWQVYQRRVHLIGVVCQALWRVGRWAVRRVITYRRKLAPLLCGLAAMVLAGALSTADGGRDTAISLVTTIIVVMGVWLYWLRPRRHRKPWPLRRQLYVWSTLTGVGGWLVAATVVGPVTPPMPGVWGTMVMAAGAPWWWHHRIRKTALQPLDEFRTLWEKCIGCDGGVLPGATILSTGQITRADDATVIADVTDVQLPPGKLTTDQTTARTGQLASAFGLAETQIAVEHMPGKRADQARILRYTEAAIKFSYPFLSPTEAFDPETGIAKIGHYPDGTPCLYRFYRPESGPWHDLIAGTTDSGKSRFLDLLLAIERHSPLITSIVIDGQGGQSLPDWVDNVAVYARTKWEGLEVLESVKEEMYRRSAILSVAEWVDAKGRRRRGIHSFTPTREMPMLSVTIDEAHLVLNLPGAGKLAEEIAKMARKCGIRLRFAVQVPLLDQLGGSTTLRDMVLSGNVIVLRTASPETGQTALHGALPVAPHKIPNEFEDHSTTAGLGYSLSVGARTSIMRIDAVGDVYDWAITGELTKTGATRIASNLAKFRANPNWRADAEAEADKAGTNEAEHVTMTSAGDKILHHLRRNSGAHRTGVIARKLGLKLSTTSQALKRLKKRGDVVDKGHGAWALADTKASELVDA